MHERAKILDVTPSTIPIAVVSAVTAAEWLLGMPPVLKAILKESSRATINLIGTLINCAKIIAENAAHRGKLENTAIKDVFLPVFSAHAASSLTQCSRRVKQKQQGRRVVITYILALIQAAGIRFAN